LIERTCGTQMIEFATSDGHGIAKDEWRKLPGVEAVHQDDSLTVLNAREPHATIPALLAAVEQRGLQLDHLTTRQASLEDVFVQLTGRHLREE
jgi:ABC-2 type transport system ATP-binding protein